MPTVYFGRTDDGKPLFHVDKRNDLTDAEMKTRNITTNEGWNAQQLGDRFGYSEEEIALQLLMAGLSGGEVHLHEGSTLDCVIREES